MIRHNVTAYFIFTASILTALNVFADTQSTTEKNEVESEAENKNNGNIFVAEPFEEKNPAELSGDEAVEEAPDLSHLKDLPAIQPLHLTAEEASRYTLGVSDVVELTVMRHPEISGQYIINQEGKIQYDFVGDVEVIGKTKDEIKEILTERLSEYIVSPDVSVKIVGYNSKVVYVIGEVGTPGKIYMRGDTITVHEALVQSGLPLLSAATKKCRLITPSEDGKASISYVNVFSLLYEGDLRENRVMKPGDTLYIPATVMAKAMRVIQPVAQPISAGRTVAPAAF